MYRYDVTRYGTCIPVPGTYQVKTNLIPYRTYVARSTNLVPVAVFPLLALLMRACQRPSFFLFLKAHKWYTVNEHHDTRLFHRFDHHNRSNLAHQSFFNSKIWKWWWENNNYWRASDLLPGRFVSSAVVIVLCWWIRNEKYHSKVSTVVVPHRTVCRGADTSSTLARYCQICISIASNYLPILALLNNLPFHWHVLPVPPSTCPIINDLRWSTAQGKNLPRFGKRNDDNPTKFSSRKFLFKR